MFFSFQWSMGSTGVHHFSFFGMMQTVNVFNGAKPETSSDGDKPPNEMEPETTSRELQQGDGTGAKPPEDGPDSIESMGSAESHASGDSADTADTADSADTGTYTHTPADGPDSIESMGSAESHAS
ncbi:hypothetical protein B5X24_HaOG216108 [Helicoverpa armigera]|uniref:Uncharacterized protein n=1 Tax=Helicoverpa armigera TaxID=29058 RepID=A0A2W1BAI6_HELAM|nr:hypothetical protein B5X24_HaOG216108 [Helicoverpa armigera]